MSAREGSQTPRDLSLSNPLAEVGGWGGGTVLRGVTCDPLLGIS